MKISVNWVKEYTAIKLPVDELVAKIGAQLGEVEEVVDLSQRYQHIVIAEVVECLKHPNADKLHVCKIDDGGVTKGVNRDENGLVQVVCGAPNVRKGLTVAWLPPGAVVPSTYDKERFTLEARELRGVTSNGMLASAAELALGDNHDGILEITEAVKPGTSFAAHYQLDDTIIDIENKMFTHRPDCFGILGVARELAGIQGEQFTSPDWYLDPLPVASNQSPDMHGYSVDNNHIPELCPRYMLIGMDNIKVAPSPVWLQTYLSRVGIRPINNIVDMTNYLMMLTGQPLHAFDFDKVAVKGKVQIIVRKPQKGEKMTLLDGKTITPRADAILICNQDKPIALGGVMGCNNSEIDANTTRILIECANFDMYNIRRTAMEHGLFTDSVTRFNKGQSPWQCSAVLSKAVTMIEELCPGAQPVGEVIDTQYPKGLHHNKKIAVTPQFINQRLGLELKGSTIRKLLGNVEFELPEVGDDAAGASLEVTAPFWRTDIAIPEDVVEEVGRLYGYDHLPLKLPRRSIAPAAKNAELELKTTLRTILAAGGANEVLTYSFVHGNLLQKAGQDPKQAFQLSNAISPDLQYYRLSLTPSLLDKVHSNIKAGYEEFALFELGKAHNKLHATDDNGVPAEFPLLSLVCAATSKAARAYGGAPFYQARQYLNYVAETLGLDLEYLPVNKELDFPVAKPYDLKRSALVGVAGTRLVLGIVGEFKQTVGKGFKLPAFCAGFELGLGELLEAQASRRAYSPLSKYPKTQQDISFRAKTSLRYSELDSLIRQSLAQAQADHGYESTVEALDIYQADDDNGHKHIAFRITLTHPERTLTTKEVNNLLDELATTAQKTLTVSRL